MFTVWQRPAREKAASLREYVLAPDVVLVQAEDGTARLLDMGGGVHVLAALEAQMLQSVLERGMVATVRDLARPTGTAPEQVQADLETLLHRLQRQGLLQLGQTRRRIGTLWPALVLVPCLRLIRWLPFMRLRAAALLILAYLSFACFGWGRTVVVWQRHLRRAARRWITPADEPAFRSLDQTVRQVATGLPLPVTGKERALACWALTCWAGAAAALIVGLELFPLAGHCWCEAGPWTLSAEAERWRLLTPVLRYPRAV